MEITSMPEEFDVEKELSGRQYMLALRLQTRKIQSLQQDNPVKGQEINPSSQDNSYKHAKSS